MNIKDMGEPLSDSSAEAYGAKRVRALSPAIKQALEHIIICVWADNMTPDKKLDAIDEIATEALSKLQSTNR